MHRALEVVFLRGISLAAVPATASVDLCTLLIAGAMAEETPEGREAVEKGRQEYIRHREAVKLKGKEGTE